jgi:hypothetical protein
MIPYKTKQGTFYAAETVDRLHTSIIEQGRLVQIGAGAMSFGEYIDWVRKQLEGK